MATSKARSKDKNPRGRRPRVFLIFGLAEDVVEGLPLENPEGVFKISQREYIEYSRDLPRAPFTMIPPRLSNRFSLFLPNALVYYIKRERQTNKLFSNGTLGSNVVNVRSRRYKY